MEGSGPCACPHGKAIHLGSVRPDGHTPTRTSTNFQWEDRNLNIMMENRRRVTSFNAQVQELLLKRFPEIRSSFSFVCRCLPGASSTSCYVNSDLVPHA